MKRFFLFSLTVSILFSCEKEAAVKDVLNNLTLTRRKMEADGQSISVVSVTVSEETDSDRRSVIFNTDKGVFTTSGKSKETVKTEFVNGVLIARASLRAPLEPSTIKVSVQPEYDSPIREYVLTDSITLAPSIPTAFTLETLRFGIGTNFSSEVRLIGNLRNASNRFVSRNNTVLFEDLLLNGAPAGGRFGRRQVLSNDTSRVSTFYAASILPVGTTIKIRGTVLDANGRKTPVADSVLLTVNF